MQTQTILRVVKCRIQETGMNVKIYLITDAQWRIQGGEFGATAPQTSVAPP